MKSKKKKKWNLEFALKDEDVMRILRVSKSTVGRLRRKGEIPSSKIGSTSYYHPDELENIVRGKRK